MAPIPLPLSSDPLLHPRHQATTPSIPQLLRRALPHLSSRSPTSAFHSITASLKRLLPRQQVFSIPSSYAGLNSGPAPGAVVGIVLGSVAGFLLALWLIYTCFGLGGGTEIVEEEIIREHRSPRRSHSSRRSEVIEVHRSRTPPRSRRETIVVEERRTTTAPPVVEAEDDIVEVIEEHSPPRRVRRGSGRQSGFRTVDPGEYAGGGRPLRKVSRR